MSVMLYTLLYCIISCSSLPLLYANTSLLFISPLYMRRCLYVFHLFRKNRAIFAFKDFKNMRGYICRGCTIWFHFLNYFRNIDFSGR